eukprot:3506938-Prymnesium_polylepis.1
MGFGSSLAGRKVEPGPTCYHDTVSGVTRASAMGRDPASAALLAGGCGTRGGHACARRSITT